MSITIKSDAFQNNGPIPTRHTGDGDNVSPPLKWEGIPAETRELVLIMDDPDAPRIEPFVHWIVYKIPPTTTGLPEAIPREKTLKTIAGAMQGENSMVRTGYVGPSPPRGHGVHHYRFHLYALSTPLRVEPGLNKQSLLASMNGNVLADGELVGTYQR